MKPSKEQLAKYHATYKQAKLEREQRRAEFIKAISDMCKAKGKSAESSS
jgi:hypothetical protein